MPSQDFPDDDTVRQSYNFAPGYYGLVYRLDTRDDGTTEEAAESTEKTESTEEHPRYRLQAMKWGLIPFWTKRNPDYGSMMKTINCRDDSLATPGGMWNTMKQRKRCIVIAQGFYEWLKKDGGKVKIPHFVKREDGQLMCFAGLWDCVKYEDAADKLYTYTIITTDSNKQLSFLHDRMPVILDNGSKELFSWLDGSKKEWSNELQSLLKPYEGKLECYPVSQDVGKVGNNSAAFMVPIDSSENKQNIANFFASPGKTKVEAPKAASPKGNSPKTDTTKKRKLSDTPTNPAKIAKANPISSKQSKSATSNDTVSKARPGGSKITNFFDAKT